MDDQPDLWRGDRNNRDQQPGTDRAPIKTVSPLRSLRVPGLDGEPGHGRKLVFIEDQVVNSLGRAEIQLQPLAG